MNDTLQLFGDLEIIVTDSNGNIKSRNFEKNIITTVGKEYIASRMLSTPTPPTAVTHMAIGTGIGEPLAANTTLGTEEARVAFTSATVSGAQLTFSATFPPGSPATLKSITEAGIFNAASAGTMLNRAKFSAVGKDTGDTLTINWTVTLT
mgnify:FL=1